MDDQPPRCFLGCCNVRSWTLAIFIISIVSLILGIIPYVTSFSSSPVDALFGIIINVVLIYINLRLRHAVIKRDIAPIRVWLWVYSMIYILFIIVGIADIIGYIGMQDTSDTKSKQLLISKIVITATYGIFGVIFFIPVYQYYNYEKSSASHNAISAVGYQTI